MKYQEIETNLGKIIIRDDENGFVSTIPTDPANADYQAYLNKHNPDYGKPTEL